MKLTKNAILGGLVATTVVAGTITFKTDLVEKVMGNIATLAAQLEDFAKNDKELVAKYEELHKEATSKISKVEQEARDEISRLEAEVTKANEAITALEDYSNDVVNATASYIPTNPDTLPGLDDEIVEEEPIAIATGTAHFYDNRVVVTVTINQDINIAVGSKGNIKIQYLNNQGQVEFTKSKIYSGYLNCNGAQFGNGFEFTDKYSNQLDAGNTYSTTWNTTKSIDQVIITVTTDRNESETITINK